jgi:hypothetical protein
MSLVTLEVKNGNSGEYKYIFIDNPVITKVPDPTHIYSIDFITSITSADDIEVEQDSNGFLKKIAAKGEDKTGDIVRTIAKTVMTLVSGVPATTTTRSLKLLPVAFKAVLDPTEPDQVAAFNRGVQKYGLRISVEIANSPSQPAIVIGDGRGSQCSSGICYRIPIPWIMRVYSTQSGIEQLQSAHILMLENKSPTIEVNVDRSAFTTRETTLSFTDGVLVGSHIKKGSEALEVVSIPFDIANAVVQLPAQIV